MRDYYPFCALAIAAVAANLTTVQKSMADPASVATGHMQIGRNWHTATLLHNGKLLAAGGYADGFITSSAEMYDPALGAWRLTASMAQARQVHTATLLPKGGVLVAGGNNNSSDTYSSVELYDPSVESWLTIQPMTRARSDHTATLLPNGRVLVAGGANNHTALSDTEIFNPIVNAWTTSAPMITARSDHTATLLRNGKVLVAGGANGGNLSSAEVYDPATYTWTPTGNLITPRHLHTATLLPDGKVLVAGGEGNGPGWLSSAEVYDPATGNWTPTANLATGRDWHTATQLPNGKVLVAGGQGAGFTVLSSAEVYDWQTAAWIQTGPLMGERWSHTANLLANGQILMAGGYSGNHLSTAELYGDPLHISAGELVAYYPFDGSALDFSGNGLTGTAANATFVTGLFGSCLSVTGSPNSLVEVPSSGLLAPSNAVSVSLWLNQRTALNQYACLLYKAGSTPTSAGFADRSYAMWVVPGGGGIHFTSAARGAPSQTATTTPSSSFGLHEWVHVVGVVDALNHTMGVYVNGSLASTISYPGNAIVSGSYPLRIGAPFVTLGDQSGFDGFIDDVRIYSRALSASEIQQLYSLPDSFSLSIDQTDRVPLQNEIASQLVDLQTTSHLLAFHGGIFTTNLASVSPNKMTVVFTHGWISNPNAWASNMASLITANVTPVPNLVAWDWSNVAAPILPGIPESQTGSEGRILAQKLLITLGSDYTNRIQFIGHSLGTLVNASAANYLQGTNWASENVSPYPWPATNILMTLFDEAEAATGITNFSAAIDVLRGRNGNPLQPKTAYDHPLPRQFAWAENYVAAFGLLHREAANVILTNNFPRSEPKGLFAWIDDLRAFHAYPIDWYDPTIQTVNSAMGFVWPFLWSVNDPTFASAPTNGSVYIQSGPPCNLVATNWNFGIDFLDGRFQAYRNALSYALTNERPSRVAISGSGSAQIVAAPPEFKGLYDSTAVSIMTKPANTSARSQFGAGPLGAAPNDAGGSTNIPAYAWVPLRIPANAVSISFDYFIQGDWVSDALAAAINGTNVLLIPGNTIQTNVTFTSGPIDISALAGQTNEMFIGIVGGTSTNAQMTVQNLAYSVSSPPVLQAQTVGKNLVLAWPLSAAGSILQYSTNLADPNSWTTLTNIPAVVNLQNTITISNSVGARFFRLKN